MKLIKFISDDPEKNVTLDEAISHALTFSKIVLFDEVIGSVTDMAFYGMKVVPSFLIIDGDEVVIDGIVSVVDGECEYMVNYIRKSLLNHLL